MAIDLELMRGRLSDVKHRDTWLTAYDYRHDVPELIGEVERLQQQLGQARELLAYCHRGYIAADEAVAEGYNQAFGEGQKSVWRLIAHRLEAIVGED